MSSLKWTCPICGYEVDPTPGTRGEAWMLMMFEHFAKHIKELWDKVEKR